MLYIGCRQETEGVCVAVLQNSQTNKQDKHDPKNSTMRKNNNNACDDRSKSNRDEAKIHQDEQTKSQEIGRVKFPSFFTAESQFAAPYSLPDELQAAHLVNSSINFGLDSGILIAVPIPKVMSYLLISHPWPSFQMFASNCLLPQNCFLPYATATFPYPNFRTRSPPLYFHSIRHCLILN